MINDTFTIEDDVFLVWADVAKLDKDAPEHFPSIFQLVGNDFFKKNNHRLTPFVFSSLDISRIDMLTKGKVWFSHDGNITVKRIN